MNHDFEPTCFDPDTDAAPAGGTPSHLVRLLRRLGVGWGASGRDKQSGLLHRQGLIDSGEQLLASPRWRRREAALAVFDFRDLLEVRGIYGPRVGAALLARVVDAMQRLGGRHGLAARTGPAQFAVLLPGFDRDSAVAAMHRVLGKPCRIEHDLPGEELVLVPDVVVDDCRDASLADLYARLAVTLARHHDHEERRQSHMRRERERHSRPMPMGLPSEAVLSARAAAAVARAEARAQARQRNAVPA